MRPRVPPGTGLAVALALSFVLPHVPATAQSDGTVEATITVAETGACLTASQASVDFGTLEFEQIGASTPTYDLTNCGQAAIDVLVRATGATGDSGATWSLVPDAPGAIVCPDSVNAFSVDVTTSDAEHVLLDTIDQPFTEELDAGRHVTRIGHLVQMPCQGSAGAGQVMRFEIVYTATSRTEPD